MGDRMRTARTEVGSTQKRKRHGKGWRAGHDDESGAAAREEVRVGLQDETNLPTPIWAVERHEHKDL